MTLKDQLKRDEGRRDIPYWDCCGRDWTEDCTRSLNDLHPGKLTVGYGWNCENPFPEEILDRLLEFSIQRARRVCEALPEYADLSPARRDAITNMVFNMGLEGYKAFKMMRAALAVGNYEEAALEMMDSKWAHQVGDRADRLAQQMRSDTWV